MTGENFTRCWATKNPLYIKYHDEEWGIPLHDDNLFFEFLALGGFQAGLTWEQILERREAFRRAFDNVYPEKVALYKDREIEILLSRPGIIHNRVKICAAINNANRFMEVQREFGTFDAFIWHFVEGKTMQNKFALLKEVPVETKESKLLSKELKKRGFQFVGPKICYALMQATGLVNDHLTICFRHDEIARMKDIV